MSNPITKKLVIYDIETLHPVAIKGQTQVPGIEYATGWKDYVGMGIACICAYQWPEQYWYVFTDGDTIADHGSEILAWASEQNMRMSIQPLMMFDKLIGSADHVIGFNNSRFDDNLLYAHNIGALLENGKSRDLLSELWLSMGLSLSAFTKFHGGSKLDDLARCNLDGLRKTEDGALAPILWAQNQKVRVVKYCIQDTEITRRLCDIVHNDGGLKHSNGNYYNMKSLYE